MNAGLSAGRTVNGMEAVSEQNPPVICLSDSVSGSVRLEGRAICVVFVVVRIWFWLLRICQSPAAVWATGVRVSLAQYCVWGKINWTERVVSICRFAIAVTVSGHWPVVAYWMV